MAKDVSRGQWLVYKHAYDLSGLRARNTWLDMEDAVESLDPELSEEFGYTPDCVSEPIFQVKRVKWHGKIGDVIQYVIWLSDGDEEFAAHISHKREDRRKIYPLIHGKKKKITPGRLIVLKRFKVGLVRVRGGPQKKHCVLLESIELVRASLRK